MICSLINNIFHKQIFPVVSINPDFLSFSTPQISQLIMNKDCVEAVLVRFFKQPYRSGLSPTLIFKNIVILVSAAKICAMRFCCLTVSMQRKSFGNFFQSAIVATFAAWISIAGFVKGGKCCRFTRIICNKSILSSCHHCRLSVGLWK